MNSSYRISLLYVTFFYVIFIASSCSSTRRLKEGEYLLTKNVIVMEDTSVDASELKRYIRQTPNRRILGFYRFHMRTYLNADRGKENRIKRWMKNAIGEPPVVYDPVLANNTVKQFQLFVQSKGYFNAEVVSQEVTSGKKMKVIYTVKGNTPYTLRNINYEVKDPFLAKFIYADTASSLIKPNINYDADVFQKERERVSRELRNTGFYEFTRDFVTFRVDTALGSKQADLEILINNPLVPITGRRDTIAEKRHRRYFISEVNVIPEYSPLRPSIPFNDTTVVFYGKRKSKYSFLHDDPLKIRPEVIARNLNIRPGEVYAIRGVEQTYSYISSLRNHRYVNINFQSTENSYNNIHPNDTIGLLEARVQLSRSPAIAYAIEAEGLNTSGNLGAGANLLFQHKNAFKGAEIFNLRLKGALEMSGDKDSYRVFESLPFNTLETGAEISFEFPKLLVPVAEDRLTQRARPKSMIMTGINYRQRPDYTRIVFNVNYGFEWSETKEKRHYVTPVEISSIRIFNDSILRLNIPDSNPLILSRFRNHLTAGLRYTYEYNTQILGRNVDFSYLRTNFETSGNMLYLASTLAGSEKDNNGHYRIFNIPYAQFIKGDFDWRRYKVLDENNTLVFRLMAGLGVPYGNADVLPFVKSYYSGGANSVRGWRIYSLGPGSYQGETSGSFDRYGDVKLEGNVEYRFPVYGFVKSALFIDAGNVWFVRANEDFEGGEFLLNKFYKDIAISGGLGVRLDFDFFVIRVDAGLPLRNPAMPEGDRWIRKVTGYKDFNYNLGIGYPF
ncbi:MAG: BamA/TamA family outer membrane protein [Bacteroidetes bacterium]|nr:BamA/TamA family outer membrane protein [Bacteroidota bacterium]